LQQLPGTPFLVPSLREARLREMLAGLANPASSRSRTRQLPEGIDKKQSHAPVFSQMSSIEV
jgi:hypothetical protein